MSGTQKKRGLGCSSPLEIVNPTRDYQRIMGNICMGTDKDTGIRRRRVAADMRMDNRDAQLVSVAASERSLAK